MTMARITLLVVSVAFLLDNLGIRVTALVTTLGVGSLAVALALQDRSATSSGIISPGRPALPPRELRPARYGDEGTVVDIGWRTNTPPHHGQQHRRGAERAPAEERHHQLRPPGFEVALSLRVTVPYGVR